MNLTPKAKATKAKINKWDHIKLKSFCTAKKTINNKKGNLWNGRKYLQMICLIMVIHKELIQISTKTIQLKNVQRDFPGGTVVKNPPASAGDVGSSPVPGRSHMPGSN